jgi:hypothetical protein
MRVYHFLNKNWALDDLRHRRMKVGEFRDLNDPFELWCFSATKEQRWAMRHTKKEMEKRFGILSFTKHWRSPLLWSHYADGHRGICLGFDVDGDIRPMQYTAERPPLPEVVTQETVMTLLFTKWTGWSYEEEWRGLSDLDRNPETNLCYMDFGVATNLREVIVGPVCDAKPPEIADALQGYEGVTITKARLAHQSFDVVTDLRGFEE